MRLRKNRMAGGGVPAQPAKFYQKKRTSSKVLVLLLTLAALSMLVFFSLLFDVKTLSITGNERVSTDTIRQASGIMLGVNTLKVDLQKVEQQISTIAFIDTVQAVRKFPNTIEITVTENQECAYIPFIGNYVGIDEKGKILEIKPQETAVGLPVILGAELVGFSIGTTIELKDESKLDTILQMIKQISINEITAKVKRIDVSDLNDIKLILDTETVVNFGDTKELTYKLSFLKQVLAQPDEKRGGVLDLSNPEKVTYKGN